MRSSFAHHDFGLGRRIQPGLSFHLEIAVIVPHHPVVADHSPRLQVKGIVQLRSPRSRPMIVLGVGGNSRESPIMFWQVLVLQKPIGLGMRPDFLATHLLPQAVLVGAVISFHPAFRLRRIGRDNANSQTTVGKATPSMRAKWRSSLSACSSALEKCLTRADIVRDAI